MNAVVNVQLTRLGGYVLATESQGLADGLARCLGWWRRDGEHYQDRVPAAPVRLAEVERLPSGVVRVVMGDVSGGIEAVRAVACAAASYSRASGGLRDFELCVSSEPIA